MLFRSLRAVADADPDMGGSGGGPPPSPGAEERLEEELRELRGRAARGRSLLRHVTEGEGGACVAGRGLKPRGGS